MVKCTDYIPVIAKWSGFKKIGEKVVEHRAKKNTAPLNSV